jgi:Glycosyl transferase family 2
VSRPAGRLVTLGTALAVAGTVHAAVNAVLLRRPDPAATPGPERVSVLVPMRDEAAQVRDCLAAVLAQDGVAEVLVLDDGSTDGTGELARAMGVRVLAGRPLPAGWLGKPHACQQLADAADPTADVLLFLDADVRLRPGAVAATVELLGDRDLVCPYPRQVAVTAAERLVQPLLQWSWMVSLPLRRAERSASPALCAANGQFLVADAAALSRAGGFGGVTGEVLDDLAVARAVKRAGGRVGVADGADLAACRMYDGWTDLSAGYRKSLWAAFGPAPASAAVAAALALAYVVPPVAALRGSRAGLVGYVAAVVSRVLAAVRSGGRAWPDPLAHPVSVAALLGLLGASWRGHRRGELTWKGRVLDGPSASGSASNSDERPVRPNVSDERHVRPNLCDEGAVGTAAAAARTDGG